MFNKRTFLVVFVIFFRVGLIEPVRSATASTNDLPYFGIVQVDPAEPIAEDELAVAITMPRNCLSADEVSICQQFADYGPEQEKSHFLYGLTSRNGSLPTQLSMLPPKLLARRFIMLVDWKLRELDHNGRTYAHLSGEVVVYDQRKKSIVWHATALSTTMPEPKYLSDFAREFVAQEVVGRFLDYQRMLAFNAERGITVTALEPEHTHDKHNFTIFNGRRELGSVPWPSSANVSITPLPPAVGPSPLSFRMPPHTYVALHLPQGHYRVSHGVDKNVEIEVAEKPRTFELSYGLFNSFQMNEIDAGRVGEILPSHRNLLLPDSRDDRQHAGSLGWTDTRSDPTSYVSHENRNANLEAERKDIPKGAPARLRLFGQNGVGASFYPNSTCFGGGAQKEVTLIGFGDAVKSIFSAVKDTTIGMRPTTSTRDIRKRDDIFIKAFYHEYEISSDQPLVVRIYFGENNSIGMVFVPRAGAEYEADLIKVDGKSAMTVREIEEHGGETELVPVEAARARQCD